MLIYIETAFSEEMEILFNKKQDPKSRRQRTFYKVNIKFGTDETEFKAEVRMWGKLGIQIHPPDMLNFPIILSTDNIASFEERTIDTVVLHLINDDREYCQFRFTSQNAERAKRKFIAMFCVSRYGI